MAGHVVLDTVADHNVHWISPQCVQKRSVEEMTIVALFALAVNIPADVQVKIELVSQLRRCASSLRSAQVMHQILAKRSVAHFCGLKFEEFTFSFLPFSLRGPSSVESIFVCN